MLLEYNVDTVDEKMVPRAVELRRRVAGRRLNDSIQKGVVDAATLVQFKESSREERHTHFTENMVLAEAMHKERIAVSRAEQQLNAAGQLRVLGRDVARASRLSKANIAVLSDLEKRIISMRQQLQQPEIVTVQQEMREELAADDTKQLESEFAQCPHCERRIVAQLLERHAKMCAERWQDRQLELQHQLIAPGEGSHRLRTSMRGGSVKADAVIPSSRSSRRSSKHLTAADLNNAAMSTKAASLLEDYTRPAVYSVQQSVVTELATFPPKPPRHCAVVAKGSTFIEWQWLPPVIDGGLAVTDYEISYRVKITEFDKVCGKFTRWEEHVPSLLTSRWCFCNAPVANSGFRITNLRAGAEYTNFRIRCCNLRGWSDWVDMISGDALQQQLQRQQQKQQESGAEAGVFALERQSPLSAAQNDSAVSSSGSNKKKQQQRAASANISLSNKNRSAVHIEQEDGFVTGSSVFTDEPEAPSPPLFVTCESVTSSCIHLSWSAPFFDGGSDISDYVVHYTILEQQITVTARNVIVEHSKKFNLLSAAQNSAVIRHLLPDTDVVRISVAAVNRVGLVSEKAPLLRQKVVRTAQCSRNSALSRELALAAKSSEPLIDTAFFTGVRQRVDRVEHMRKLQEELELTPSDAAEVQELKEWAAVVELKQRRRDAEEVALRQLQELQLDNEEDDDGDDGSIGIAAAAVVDNDSLHNSKKRLSESIRRDMHYAKSISNDEVLASFVFTIRQRRNHFKRKLHSLEQQMVSLHQERSDIDRSRARSNMEMRLREEKARAFRLEIERMHSYEGVTVTSDALSGTNMQYKTADYRKRIVAEYERALQDIAGIKYKVITGENRRQAIKGELTAAQEAKQERTARFHDFEKQFTKTVRIVERLAALTGGSSSGRFGVLSSEESRESLLVTYFSLLRTHMHERQSQRTRITDLFLRVVQRSLRSAFSKWRDGNFEHGQLVEAEVHTRGDVMLKQAATRRLDLQLQLRAAIAGTATIEQKIQMVQLSKVRKLRLQSSVDFKRMEEGIDHSGLHFKSGLKMLHEGDGYARLNKFDMAQSMYESQIWWIRSRPQLQQQQLDIKALAICHGRLGRMFLQLGKKNRAIVEFDRQLSLAREIGDKPEEADAFHGLGSGYMANFDYENAIRYLSIAQTLLGALNSSSKYAAAIRALQDCYERIGKQEKALICKERVAEVEGDISSKIELINFKLADMRSRLISNAAEIENIVKIERTTFQALHLKNLIGQKEQDIRELEEQRDQQHDTCAGVEAKIDAINRELQLAVATDEPEMMSAMLHDQPQVVEIEELKTRLAALQDQEAAVLKVEVAKEKVLEVKIRNAENDIDEADQQLELEEGALMRHSRLDKPFRCIALCAANAAGNEVTGTGSGGFEEFPCAEGANIHLIDYHSGELRHVFIGGNAETGHSGVVTCLVHDGDLIFSGGSDECIMVWNYHTKQRLQVLTGHEGSIVALAVESELLLSSASDTTLRLWSKKTFEQLRVVYGHTRSVLTMEIGPTWMLTGSTDTEVRVWRLERQKKGSLVAECQYRLKGHEVPVTCVRYGQVEVLSGDVLGRIFVWWMQTGEIIRKCQVHKGPVKCLQFDAIHIVSGGVDMSVNITDIATGEVLQSLRGHTGHVLNVAFDSERIISVGGDNSIRYWQWGQQGGPQDKVHVLDKGQTLASVAKRYTITLDELMKWNGILDVRHCFPGMKLIVRKGDPSQPTAAEKAVLDKERRSKGGLKLASKLSRMSEMDDQLLASDEARLFSYNRVHKNATDIDFYSMGNRMFSQEKRQQELFPDDFDPNYNPLSLAARLNSAEASIIAKDRKSSSSMQPQQQRGARYYVDPEGVEEWGPVADALALTMLTMLVEYEAYDVVMEQKRQLRSKQSVIGRINKWQLELEKSKEQRHEATNSIIDVNMQQQQSGGSTLSTIKEVDESEGAGASLAVTHSRPEEERGAELLSTAALNRRQRKNARRKQREVLGVARLQEKQILSHTVSDIETVTVLVKSLPPVLEDTVMPIDGVTAIDGGDNENNGSRFPAIAAGNTAPYPLLPMNRQEGTDPILSFPPIT